MPLFAVLSQSEIIADDMPNNRRIEIMHGYRREICNDNYNPIIIHIDDYV